MAKKQPPRKQQYEGGYYFIEQPLIRAGIYQHTAAVENAMSDDTVTALNRVQATPWRINTRILDTIMSAYHSGMDVGDLPYHDMLDVPRKTDEEWEAMTPDEKGEWKRKLSQIHGYNARLEGRRKSFASKLNIARKLRNQEAIYFPHFLDFRGRFYPMPTDLHPQSDDIGKSLLEFAKGKPLGRRGFFWLCVRAANAFGQDKISLNERFQWVQDNIHLIMDCGEFPLDGERFWEDADEPFSFLATTMEITEALASGDVETYVSHLPIPMDGSCNGLQHLSAIGRDRVGAEATNVAANEEREDIYTQVADKVKDMVSKDAAQGHEEAQKWVGMVGRKTVKRAVMTTPYGVTPRGISDQLVEDGHTKGMDNGGKAAVYLRKCIEAAMDETVVSAKQIMSWLQDVSAELSRNGIPFVFQTPTGNTIQQSYYTVHQKRIRTLFGNLAVWEEDPIGGLNDRKQTLASAPNLIHAFDASHLVMTVNSMAEQVEDPCYAMIHDSFGCHAADTEALNNQIREQFVNIYRTDWLEELQRQFEGLIPEDSEIVLPTWQEYIEKGDFDPEECLRSEFFFS